MKSINRQTIDNTLFLYGGIVAFVLTVIAFFNIKGINSLITLILFLPVSVYFIYRSLIIMGTKAQSLLNHNRARHPYFGDFSLAAFFSQDNTLFLITLCIICLAITIILFRISLNSIE